ncbi:Deoxyribonuclease II [Cinara cedri]|uniref:Deoxyribonuclease II n=1 Tax=Cinara cedri TaxID=506608 RepID=A0A5E4MQQ4_9HEMI|nr:Deoxyribonuclease II [Cinara cedri]
MILFGMDRALVPMFVVTAAIAAAAVSRDGIQCKDPHGQPVDWFTAIKLPNLHSNVSIGTVYVYLDAKSSEWTRLTDINTEDSAIGHTVSQMYAKTENYNNSIMWVVYNDEPTNEPVSFTMGHTKGIVMADHSMGFWLVHSVPKFPQLPYENNNTYTYPHTGLMYGQSFLCMSMTNNELDNVGNQIINNEAYVYGSHFGNNLKNIYPGLYNTTLPWVHSSKVNNGVRLQSLQSINGIKFLSVSKNRHFGKDLYEDLITPMTQSNVYVQSWLNSKGSLNSSCSSQYKAMNIKSLSMKKIKGLETCWYKTSKDHSKWVITGKFSVPWTCIGDINRAKTQFHRGGGTVCINSTTIWNEFKKLVLNIEKCKLS